MSRARSLGRTLFRMTVLRKQGVVDIILALEWNAECGMREMRSAGCISVGVWVKISDTTDTECSLTICPMHQGNA